MVSSAPDLLDVLSGLSQRGGERISRPAREIDDGAGSRSAIPVPIPGRQTAPPGNVEEEGRKEEAIGFCHMLIDDKPAHSKPALTVDDLVPVSVVEVKGIEPLAPCMQSRCSPAELHPHVI